MPTNKKGDVVQQDYILLKDVNYFGRLIKKGSTFKETRTSNDYYELWENNKGILMHCPAVTIHFSSLNEEYFIKQYQ